CGRRRTSRLRAAVGRSTRRRKPAAPWQASCCRSRCGPCCRSAGSSLHAGTRPLALCSSLSASSLSSLPIPLVGLSSFSYACAFLAASRTFSAALVDSWHRSGCFVANLAGPYILATNRGVPCCRDPPAGRASETHHPLYTSYKPCTEYVAEAHIRSLGT